MSLKRCVEHLGTRQTRLWVICPGASTFERTGAGGGFSGEEGGAGVASGGVGGGC